MTGKGIGKRGRFALVFNLRVIIVCRRLATTYGKAAVKGNFALGLGGEIQGVIHIELILKDQRERGNFIGQEERESTFSTKERNRQEFATYPLGKVVQKFLFIDVLETKIKLLGSNGSI